MFLLIDQENLNLFRTDSQFQLICQDWGQSKIYKANVKTESQGYVRCRRTIRLKFSLWCLLPMCRQKFKEVCWKLIKMQMTLYLAKKKCFETNQNLCLKFVGWQKRNSIVFWFVTTQLLFISFSRCLRTSTVPNSAIYEWI